MRILKCNLLILFLLCINFCVAQKNISGIWEGKLVQYEGAVWTDYYFKINISQKNGRLLGLCSVIVEKEFASMEFTGKILNNKLHLEEKTLLRHSERSDFEWCLKVIDLNYFVKEKIEHLEGDWTGKTLNGVTCIPGKIFLKRGSERV